MAGSFYDIAKGSAKRKWIKSDTRRIGLLLLLLALSASVNHYMLIASLGGCVLLLCLLYGIRWKYALIRITLLLPFGMIAILLIPFNIPGEAVTTIFYWSMTYEGLILAGVLLSKLLICHFIICLILSTTTSVQLLRTLNRFGVPELIIEIMLFALRYMAVLFEQIETMILSQQSRGFSVRSFSSWASYRRSGELLGTLLIRSYERSSRIYDSMLARGYEYAPIEEATEDVRRKY